jgi:hypothetical protein
MKNATIAGPWWREAAANQWSDKSVAASARELTLAGEISALREQVRAVRVGSADIARHAT